MQTFDVVMRWLPKHHKYVMEEPDKAGTAVQEGSIRFWARWPKFWNCKRIQGRFENINKEIPHLYEITVKDKGEYPQAIKKG
jgi:hypothetical protein